MRNIEIVELLLDKGAKVSAVDKVKNICLFTVVYLIILVLKENFVVSCQCYCRNKASHMRNI